MTERGIDDEMDYIFSSMVLVWWRTKLYQVAGTVPADQRSQMPRLNSKE